MVTPEEIRIERLRSDSVEMGRLQRTFIRVTPYGTPPESYQLTINVRSIIGPGPDYRNEHTVRLQLGSGYPFSRPHLTILTFPPPFHPNWFLDGGWCGGEWQPEESLAQHVLRMIRTLQFDPAVTNPDSPANDKAATWYRRHEHAGLFPCDRTPLPDPSRSRVELEVPRRRVVLLSDRSEAQ